MSETSNSNAVMMLKSSNIQLFQLCITFQLHLKHLLPVSYNDLILFLWSGVEWSVSYLLLKGHPNI